MEHSWWTEWTMFFFFIGGADVNALSLWLFLIILLLLLLLFLHMYENNFVGTVLIRWGEIKKNIYIIPTSPTHTNYSFKMLLARPLLFKWSPS